MWILHVWSATSEKLANEVFKAWQEIRTKKRILDKARTMCWSGPDDICTSMINTAKKGNLTRARIWYCTVFVEYYSGYVFVALMMDLTAESTLAAKKEFEHRCAVWGVKVEHYLTHNGIFAEPAWINECKRCKQDLTFCGVGVHHQNGILESKIKDDTLISRKMLLHAI